MSRIAFVFVMSEPWFRAPEVCLSAETCLPRCPRPKSLFFLGDLRAEQLDPPGCEGGSRKSWSGIKVAEVQPASSIQTPSLWQCLSLSLMTLAGTITRSARSRQYSSGPNSQLSLGEKSLGYWAFPSRVCTNSLGPTWPCPWSTPLFTAWGFI